MIKMLFTDFHRSTTSPVRTLDGRARTPLINTGFLYLVLFILLALLQSGCSPIFSMEVPVVLAQIPDTATPTRALVMAPPNATPTPTPFQPLAPTEYVQPTETPLSTHTPVPVEPTPQPAQSKKKNSPTGRITQPEGQINILLLGSDQRPWSGNFFRTDTILLATLNREFGTVNLTSFPRDLYINIPGYGQDRINTVWQRGEFPLMVKTFEQNFGVRPDHYVLISFSSFKEIIDGLGGLDVNVETAVSDYRSGYYVTIPAGMNHMDADTVLWYVRSRKTTNDFARNRRQQEVLKAIFEKMLSLNAIKRVPEFYEIYKDNVVTNIGFTDAIRLLPLAAKISDTSRIKQYYIGPKHVYNWITPGGAMVLLPDQSAIMNVMRKALNSD